MFAEKGYEGAGVAEIARRAGLHHRRHLRPLHRQGRAAARRHRGPIQDNELDRLFNEHQFEGKVTDILTTVGSHLVTDELGPNSALLLEAFVAARRDPEVRRRVQGVARPPRRPASPSSSPRRQATGAIDPSLDTEAVVRFCHAVGFGFLLFRAVELDLPDPEPWEQLIAHLVDALDVAPPSTDR